MNNDSLLDLAPIVLFVYKRPVHTRKVLDALAKCKESRNSILYIFADGPKEKISYDEMRNIKEVRDLVNSENRFLSIKIVFAEKNKGCAKSIIDGVDHVIEKHGKIIVLEDDIVVSNGFLEYMNFCLKYFKDEEEIASVNAFSHNIPNLPDYYLLKGGDCWGWGTWERGWKLFNSDAGYLYETYKDTGILEKWETGNLVSTLKSAIEYPNNIWDIQWSLSLFINNKLGIWPNKSYLYNIGYDGTGTNILIDFSEITLFKPRLNNITNEKFIVRMNREENLNCREKLIDFKEQQNYEKLKNKKKYFNKIISKFKRFKFQFKLHV
jgi:hypothetical protein